MHEPLLCLSSWYHLCAYVLIILTSFTTPNNQLSSRKCAHTTMAYWIIFSPSFSSSFYTSPLQPHNSALLGCEGKLGAGAKRQLSTQEREACCFCTVDGHLVELLALPAPPPSLLPSNGGLEQSEQGHSDSGSRLADDLLAGLESSEPRQLKWSLKLEPTCREGRREPARERKQKGGGRQGGQRKEGACTQLLCRDRWTDWVNSTVGEHNEGDIIRIDTLAAWAGLIDFMLQQAYKHRLKK